MAVKAKLYNRWKFQTKELAIIEFFDITLTYISEDKEWSIEFTLFNFGIMIYSSKYTYS